MNSLPVNPRLPEIRWHESPSLFTFHPFFAKGTLFPADRPASSAPSPRSHFFLREGAPACGMSGRAPVNGDDVTASAALPSNTEKEDDGIDANGRPSQFHRERRLLGPLSTLVASFRSRLVFFLLFGQGVPLPR